MAQASTNNDAPQELTLAELKDIHPDDLTRDQRNRLSTLAAKDYADKLKKRDDLDPKDRKILTLYDQGVQNFEIARQVFDGMVNADTVGRVVLAIRREHAEDFDEVEDIESTRGYTGVARGGQSVI